MPLFERTQVSSIVNDATKNYIGEVPVLESDLSNVVDVGSAVLGSINAPIMVENMVARIYDVMFRAQSYEGWAPNVMVDKIEYGLIKEKISFDLPEAADDGTFKVRDKNTYDPFVVNLPKAHVKYWHKQTTFTIPMTIQKEQIKNAFTSAAQLMSFFDAVFVYINNSMKIKQDELIMLCIDNMVAETIKREYGETARNEASHVTARNLLYEYNTKHGTTLTKDNCLTNQDFLRYAEIEMSKTADRMKVMGKTFNDGTIARATNDSERKTVVLADFKRAAEVYLNAANGQFKDIDLIKGAETVPFWMASGDDWTDVSLIKIKDAEGATFEQDGILATMFNKYALGVCNIDNSVETDRNGRYRYTNYTYFASHSYWNDTSEDFVVFFVA